MDDWEFYPGLDLVSLLEFSYALIMDRTESAEDREDLDRALGLAGQADEKAKTLETLSEFGEVHVEGGS